MAARQLLVTGFGPFPTVPRNPSAAAARAVAAAPLWRRLDVAARAVILTTAYATLPRELDPALATGPDAVLMIGVASRATRIRIEWRATNRRSTLFPDVAGERAEMATAARGRPVLRTPLPAAKMLLVLQRHGLPARLSRDAGRYLCNASYARALASGLPVLFVHIPKTPDPTRPRRNRRRVERWEQRLSAALAEIAAAMLREARSRTRVERRPALG